jgi:5-methylcytosine-specific restriction endonuclease McrA
MLDIFASLVLFYCIAYDAQAKIWFMKLKKSKRFFNSRQRVTLFLHNAGVCPNCGIELEAGWHGDHLLPYSRGGETILENGQALCAKCNLRKSDKEIES